MNKIYLITATLIALTYNAFTQNTSCSVVYDDFSNSALWTHPVLPASLQNAAVFNTLAIAGGEFIFGQSQDYNMNYMYRSGFTISDSDFKANIDFRHTSNGTTAGGAGHVLLALNSDSEPFFNSTSSTSIASLSPSIHEGISVSFESDLDNAPTDFFFKVYLTDAGTVTSVGTPISVGGPLPSGSMDYFIELIRSGTNFGLLNVYSDPARTMLINTSGWFSIPSSITTLTTVQIGTHEWQNQARMLTGKLDNLCIDNTVVITNPNSCNSVYDDFSNPSFWAHPILSTVLACNTLATMTINSGQFQFLQSRDNNFNYMNRSGLTISDSDFKADIDFTHTSNGVSGGLTGGAGHTILALNNGAKPFFSEPTSVGLPGNSCTTNPLTLTVANQKGIAVTFESDFPEDPTNFFFKVYINDGSGVFPTVNPTTIAVGPAGIGGLNTDYYIRLERAGTTSGSLSVYSDVSRTVLIGSFTFTIPTTISGLNTVQIGGNEWQEEQRMLTGILDNLCIHNNTPSAINTIEKDNNIVNVFPNPTNDILNIKSLETILQIEIFDFNGRKIYSEEQDSNAVSVNLDKFSKGIYLVQIATKNGLKTKKVIKN